MNGGRAILPPYTHHETTRVDVLCDTPTRNVGAISKTNDILDKSVESWYIPEHVPCQTGIKESDTPDLEEVGPKPEA